MSGLYDFSGGSLDVNAVADLPPATANGGFFDTGVSLLNNVADKWLQYQDIKTRSDLEYSSYDNPANPNYRGSAVPSWVWIVGALGLGLVAYRAVS